MTSRPACGNQMGSMCVGATVGEDGGNQPYVVADDVDCAGLIWAVLGADDPELEQEMMDVLHGPTNPIVSPLEGVTQGWERPLQPGEPLLHATHTIGSLRGIRLIWIANQEERTLNFATLFNVGTFREAFDFQIDSIEVSPDGTQARANGALVVGSEATAGLSFFITDWYDIRQLLLPGDTHKFGLGIWASALRPAEPFRMDMPTADWIKNKPPEVLEIMGDMISGPTISIVGDEMRTLYGQDKANGREDIVHFRGQVMSCRKLRAEMMGWPMWDVLVNVLDIDDQPIRMKIVVTEPVLEDRPPPKRGQWIEGNGWLQGNLIELGKRGGKGAVTDDI